MLVVSMHAINSLYEPAKECSRVKKLVEKMQSAIACLQYGDADANLYMLWELKPKPVRVCKPCKRDFPKVPPFQV